MHQVHQLQQQHNMLYTKKGYNGSSSTLHTKARKKKDDPLFEALGTLDELNSLLGVCRSYAQVERSKPIDVAQSLFHVQDTLFSIQAICAGSDVCQITQKHITDMEHTISAIEKEIAPITNFTIPVSMRLSAYLDYARSVARRAERMIVALPSKYSNEHIKIGTRLANSC